MSGNETEKKQKSPEFIRGECQERNVVVKDHRRVRLRFALAYPSPYFVGMSNLAVRLLYELINNRDDALCERFFFTEYGGLPRSIESGMPLKNFDVVGFSLQHEMDYLRMLDMISRSGLPLNLKSAERTEPVIIAGGPSVTSNPLPLAPFVDFFVIGEVEPILDRLLDGLPGKRENIEEALGSIPGVYRYGSTAERISVKDLNTAYHSVRQVHSTSDGDFSSSFLLEVSRGCSRGCRFCMECFLYSPKRERSLETINRIVEEGIPLTGMNKVTCISSALFDHSDLTGILAYLRDRGLRFSLPSVRISDVKEDLMELLASGGQRTLTLAPETPSERLRSIINKRFEDDQLYGTLSKAREAGIRSVKLYFMLGIPGETDSDVAELKNMLSRIMSVGFRPNSIHISVNLMIPKSNTPFQWAPVIGRKDFDRRLTAFRRICSDLGIRRVEAMDYRWGVIQAYLSTAGVEASEVLNSLVLDLERGGRADLGAWRRILGEYGREIEDLYVSKKVDDPLPWESIKGAIPKSILRHEFERAMVDAYARDI
jgi:radical SAM superfamily enzyme YgiQ (UPF0313 family)